MLNYKKPIKVKSKLMENQQVTIAPADTNTQVIKAGNKTIGTVSNPTVANQLKTAIQKGEVNLAQDLKESNNKWVLFMVMPPKHKVLVAGFPMDTQDEAIRFKKTQRNPNDWQVMPFTDFKSLLKSKYIDFDIEYPVKGGREVTDVADYLDSTAITESAPKDQEQWIKDNKDKFIKQYGKKGEAILYATAWQRHNKGVKESKELDLDKLFESVAFDEPDPVSHILSKFKFEVNQFCQGQQINPDLYDCLYDYYLDAGLMPYGVAKARDANPIEWVSSKLKEYLGQCGVSQQTSQPLDSQAEVQNEQPVPEYGDDAGQPESPETGVDDLLEASKQDDAFRLVRDACNDVLVRGGWLGYAKETDRNGLHSVRFSTKDGNGFVTVFETPTKATIVANGKKFKSAGIKFTYRVNDKTKQSGDIVDVAKFKQVLHTMVTDAKELTEQEIDQMFESILGNRMINEGWTDDKKVIMTRLAPVLSKYKLKATVGLFNNNTIQLKITSGDIDFVTNTVNKSTHDKGYCARVLKTKNIQVSKDGFQTAFTGRAVEALAELFKAIKYGDYGSYFTIYIGGIDGSYKLTGQKEKWNTSAQEQLGLTNESKIKESMTTLNEASELKAKISELIKPVLKKYNLKGTISSPSSGLTETIVLKLKSGDLDFIGNYVNTFGAASSFNENSQRAAKYALKNQYLAVYKDYKSKFSGKVLAAINELYSALNTDNHDNSDVTRDYFDVGHYIDFRIGSDVAPYVCTGKKEPITDKATNRLNQVLESKIKESKMPALTPQQRRDPKFIEKLVSQAMIKFFEAKGFSKVKDTILEKEIGPNYVTVEIEKSRGYETYTYQDEIFNAPPMVIKMEMDGKTLSEKSVEGVEPDSLQKLFTRTYEPLTSKIKESKMKVTQPKRKQVSESSIDRKARQLVNSWNLKLKQKLKESTHKWEMFMVIPKKQKVLLVGFPMNTQDEALNFRKAQRNPNDWQVMPQPDFRSLLKSKYINFEIEYPVRGGREIADVVDYLDSNTIAESAPKGQEQRVKDLKESTVTPKRKLREGVSISTSQSQGFGYDEIDGNTSINVCATGEDAIRLAEILRDAGFGQFKQSHIAVPQQTIVGDYHDDAGEVQQPEYDPMPEYDETQPEADYDTDHVKGDDESQLLDRIKQFVSYGAETPVEEITESEDMGDSEVVVYNGKLGIVVDADTGADNEYEVMFADGTEIISGTDLEPATQAQINASKDIVKYVGDDAQFAGRYGVIIEEDGDEYHVAFSDGETWIVGSDLEAPALQESFANEYQMSEPAQTNYMTHGISGGLNSLRRSQATGNVTRISTMESKGKGRKMLKESKQAVGKPSDELASMANLVEAISVQQRMKFGA